MRIIYVKIVWNCKSGSRVSICCRSEEKSMEKHFDRLCALNNPLLLGTACVTEKKYPKINRKKTRTLLTDNPRFTIIQLYLIWAPADRHLPYTSFDSRFYYIFKRCKSTRQRAGHFLLWLLSLTWKIIPIKLVGPLIRYHYRVDA